MDSSLAHFVAYPLAIASLAFLYLRVLLECWLHGRAVEEGSDRRSRAGATAASHKRLLTAFAATAAHEGER